MKHGYYRYPTVHKSKLAFTCEDDIWLTTLDGAKAERLTYSFEQNFNPHFSPDGKHIAFLGRDEGQLEVYIINTEGGPAKRLTYSTNLRSHICGWSKDGNYIIYCSSFQQPFYRNNLFFKIHKNGGLPENLNLGHGYHISYASKNRCVIGRNTDRIERWKRYRGGTAGKIWIDKKGQGDFEEWTDIDGNLNCPMWIGERIYFLSDHEGFGNIYSIKPNGSDIEKHTNHKTYFCKQATTDGETIVYANGANIYSLDVKTNKSKQVDFDFKSAGVQQQHKFVKGSDYLQSYNIHPEGHSLLINARGKGFEFANWEGAIHHLENENCLRQRLLTYFNNKETVAYLADDGTTKNEHIELYDLTKNKITKFKDLDIGRPTNLKISPNDKMIALDNHKGELIIVDIAKQSTKLIAKAGLGRINGFNWSRDSKWIAFGIEDEEYVGSIKLYSIGNKKITQITEGTFIDTDPCFSYCGNYLYFLSYRIFNPVYDSIYFDLNFPQTQKPFCVVLNKNATNPFIPKKKPLNGFNKENGTYKEINNINIDFDGIEQRIVAMPVTEGIYKNLYCSPESVLYIKKPITGALQYARNAEPNNGELKFWDLTEQEEKTLVEAVNDFDFAFKSNAIVARSGKKLRVLPFETDLKVSKSQKTDRKNGWIDLGRIQIDVKPKQEWRQMYNEIWRLQKQHFWQENMSGVDWDKVYNRYLPLVDRLGARSEFSDLAWEMQGELGTSHAYEMGGDYRKGKTYNIGYLGCNFVYDKKEKAYKITNIATGDNWAAGYQSPLLKPGINVKVGDFITAINHKTLTQTYSPYQALVNFANKKVTLEIKDAKAKKTKNITVHTLNDEQKLRYRNWVDANKAYVHKKTKGQVGYVHIPNMGAEGYSEFHRYYSTEANKIGLIVDVRFNGGGHVSQLIIEKLAKKRLGYDLSRWDKVVHPYPAHSVLGPIVALTNEDAGSDGDIFSHVFKLMNIGPLVGRRTWGGVVGIWPRHGLVDGAVTTQPEFSFWFNDVGFGVENYGTDPDIFVDISPQDYKAGKDVQLDKAIEVNLKRIKTEKPKVPNFGPKPNLKLPG